MGLRDEAAALSGNTGPRTTTLYRLIDTLSGDERADVIALVWDDHHITSTAAAQVLSNHYSDRFGIITDQQVRHHRRSKPRP